MFNFLKRKTKVATGPYVPNAFPYAQVSDLSFPFHSVNLGGPVPHVGAVFPPKMINRGADFPSPSSIYIDPSQG